MSSSVSVISNLGLLAPAVENRAAKYDIIYGEHCHRIYSLAFWMTDNELTAEQLSSNTFLRAFASSAEPRTEQIDQAFLAEIREITTISPQTALPFDMARLLPNQGMDEPMGVGMAAARVITESNRGTKQWCRQS